MLSPIRHISTNLLRDMKIKSIAKFYLTQNIVCFLSYLSFRFDSEQTGPSKASKTEKILNLSVGAFVVTGIFDHFSLLRPLNPQQVDRQVVVIRCAV